MEMMMFRTRDIFNATLVESESLEISLEQQYLIREILEKACSDTAFAKKAYAAIYLVLTKGPTPAPSITSLNPTTIAIGDPSTTLHVVGENFGPTPTIVFNGFDEPTTVVSPTEITTGINMDVWAAPAVVPVTVRTNDGITSEPMNFEFTEAASPEVVREAVDENLYERVNGE